MVGKIVTILPNERPFKESLPYFFFDHTDCVFEGLDDGLALECFYRQ